MSQTFYCIDQGIFQNHFALKYRDWTALSRSLQAIFVEKCVLICMYVYLKDRTTIFRENRFSYGVVLNLCEQGISDFQVVLRVGYSKFSRSLWMTSFPHYSRFYLIENKQKKKPILRIPLWNTCITSLIPVIFLQICGKNSFTYLGKNI